MTLAQVNTLVESIGLPCSYYQFSKDTAKPPPFICWYCPSNDDFLADNTNYSEILNLTIELYTDSKDFDQEAAVEAVLKQNGLVYSRQEEYIDAEKMYLVTFYTEVLING